MDVEEQVVNSLTDLRKLRELWTEGLRPEHFVDSTNRAAFLFAIDYWQSDSLQSAPTKEVLETEFPSLTIGTSDESTGWLVSHLIERYKGNEVQRVIKQAAVELSEGRETEALNGLLAGTLSVVSNTTSRANKSEMSSNIVERRKRFEDRALFKGDVRGAPTGFKDIDEFTDGILPGRLVAVAGYAKTGKTMFLCQSAVEARKAGWTPYICTMELDVEEVEDRIDAIISGVDMESLTKGQLTPEDLRKLTDSQDEFASLGPIFVEKPQVGERTVKRIVSRAREVGADYLIIDQLSFMESTKGYSSIQEKTTEIMQDLKPEISADERSMIPCLLAVQFNRASVSEKGQLGGLQHLAQSASIERTVDMAIGLYATEELRVNRSMIAKIIGRRAGALNAWLLEWSLRGETKFGVRSEYEE